MKLGHYILISKNHYGIATKTQIQAIIKQLIKLEGYDLKDSERKIIILKPSKTDIIKSYSKIKFNNSDILRVIKF
jgi:hypothetical protein